jgi:hypothetical protein
MKDCMEMLPGRLKALKALTSGNAGVVNMAWERARRRYEAESGAESGVAISGDSRDRGAAQEERRVWQII